MASPHPVLRIHARNETCPVCDQPIPNEKAQEVRVRIEARERAVVEAANASATLQVAADKVRIEAAAKATVDKVRKESEEALVRSLAESAASVETARLEGHKVAEAALAVKLAAVEKAKAEAVAAATAKIAVTEQKIAATETEKQTALAQVQALKAEQETVVGKRVQEARDALEREKADALATAKAKHDADTQKLSGQLDILRRQLEKQRAEELGEGAEVKLFDALKAEFPEDNIRRVKKGVSGADIIHTIVQNGKTCGSIIYDSKNSIAWRDDYVAKLIQDQTAAKADHAVLTTFKFPAGTSQIEVRDNVIIVNPARAVATVGILRRHMLTVHTLRLGKNEQAKKMAALYDFITSPRFAHLLERINSESELLLALQESEKKAHDAHWKKEGLALRSIQKVKAELTMEMDQIVSGYPADDDEDGQQV